MTNKIEELEKEIEKDNQDLLKNGLDRAGDIAIMNDNQMKVLNREMLKAELKGLKEGIEIGKNEVYKELQEKGTIAEAFYSQNFNKRIKSQGVGSCSDELKPASLTIAEVEKMIMKVLDENLECYPRYRLLEFIQKLQEMKK